WSPDGKRLALGSQAGRVRVLDFPAGTEVQRFSFFGPVYWLNFSPDGSLLAVAGEANPRLWDCQKQAVATGAPEHPAPVDSITFTPRGDRLATGCRDGGVRVFAVAADTTKPLFSPIPHDEWQPNRHGSRPISPLFVDEGRQLLTVSERQLIWSD